MLGPTGVRVQYRPLNVFAQVKSCQLGSWNIISGWREVFFSGTRVFERNEKVQVCVLKEARFFCVVLSLVRFRVPNTFQTKWVALKQDKSLLFTQQNYNKTFQQFQVPFQSSLLYFSRVVVSKHKTEELKYYIRRQTAVSADGIWLKWRSEVQAGSLIFTIWSFLIQIHLF